MAVIGGPNSNYEKLFAKSIKSLDKKITYRTNKISAILAAAYNSPNASAKYWRTVKNDLAVQYYALNKVYASWAKVYIPVAYKAAVKDLFTRLNKSKAVASLAKKTYSDLVTGSKAMMIQNILIKDAITDWSAALATGQANLTRLTRKTQQYLVSESLIDKSVVEAISSGNLMNNTYIKSINMSNTLAGQLNEVATIIDGNKYVIAGSKRFSPKYYAEMVSRTKFHEAQAQGAIQTAVNYGTSLLQVSAHNTTTALCVPYEGKIYSVGGKDSRFPPLDNTPPYHPNCLHLLFPMFESAMEVDKSLAQWVDFSNGTVAIPPSPASFIPVSDRSV